MPIGVEPPTVASYVVRIVIPAAERWCEQRAEAIAEQGRDALTAVHDVLGDGTHVLCVSTYVVGVGSMEAVEHAAGLARDSLPDLAEDLWMCNIEIEGSDLDPPRPRGDIYAPSPS